MYRITIHDKSFFTDTEERSHHHFGSAEAALRFMAALESPRKMFVSEVSGQGDEIDIDRFIASCKKLAEDMKFESWREENR